MLPQKRKTQHGVTDRCQDLFCTRTNNHQGTYIRVPPYVNLNMVGRCVWTSCAIFQLVYLHLMLTYQFPWVGMLLILVTWRYDNSSTYCQVMKCTCEVTWIRGRGLKSNGTLRLPVTRLLLRMLMMSVFQSDTVHCYALFVLYCWLPSIPLLILQHGIEHLVCLLELRSLD